MAADFARPRRAGLRHSTRHYLAVQPPTRLPEYSVVIDASMPLHWAVDALQPRAAIQGNLDNVLLLEGGRRLESAVERILTTLSAGRFIFNLGHGVLPDTPVAHVQRVVDAVRAFRRG